MTPDHPYLSVIVPVKNGHSVLPRMLDMLSRSALPRESWELIVIDDGSTDDSSAIASEYADLVIRLPAPSHGPGYARNRGVERARGECIVFLDADCGSGDVCQAGYCVENPMSAGQCIYNGDCGASGNMQINSNWFPSGSRK